MPPEPGYPPVPGVQAGGPQYRTNARKIRPGERRDGPEGVARPAGLPLRNGAGTTQGRAGQPLPAFQVPQRGAWPREPEPAPFRSAGPQVPPCSVPSRLRPGHPRWEAWAPSPGGGHRTRQIRPESGPSVPLLPPWTTSREWTLRGHFLSQCSRDLPDGMPVPAKTPGHRHRRHSPGRLFR